jgi:predicted ferric reductase
LKKILFSFIVSVFKKENMPKWFFKCKLHFLCVGLSLPVFVAWMILSPLSVRLQDVGMAWKSVAQVTGLLGILWFSFALILSARFRVCEKWFGPLDQMYLFHRKLGEVSFLFLLIHPIGALISSIIMRPDRIADLIIPGRSLPVTWGMLSSFLMIILLGVTLYFQLKYHVWKQTHQWMGLAFFLGSLHAFFIGSDLSRSVFLRVYILGFAVFALGCFVAYSIFNRWSVRQTLYQVNKINRLSKDVMNIQMKPKGKSIHFFPGQFIFVRFFLNGTWGESHPFSLTSNPKDLFLSLSFKVLGDDTSDLYNKMTVGTEVKVEGPFGSFGKQCDKAERLICIAGGIGVTPVLSMFSLLSSTQCADVYYPVKQEQEAVHLPELFRLQSLCPKSRIIPWVTERDGYLTAEAIDTSSRLTPFDHIYLCGPVEMMENLQNQLKKRGVSSDRIHFESFAFR